MTPSKLFERLDKAATETPVRHRKSACPDCGDEGPHDDNGEHGHDLSFACRACGMHFDAYDWV